MPRGKSSRGALKTVPRSVALMTILRSTPDGWRNLQGLRQILTRPTSYGKSPAVTVPDPIAFHLLNGMVQTIQAGRPGK